MGTIVNKRNDLFEMEPRTYSVHIIRVVMPAACERSPEQASHGGGPLRLPHLLSIVMKTAQTASATFAS